jgi:hypothetical protein
MRRWKKPFPRKTSPDKKHRFNLKGRIRLRPFFYGIDIIYAWVAHRLGIVEKVSLLDRVLNPGNGICDPIP